METEQLKEMLKLKGLMLCGDVWGLRTWDSVPYLPLPATAYLPGDSGLVWEVLSPAFCKIFSLYRYPGLKKCIFHILCRI